MTHSVARRFRLIGAIAIVACSREGDEAGVSLGQALLSDSALRVREAHALLGPAAQVALDSANALFRKKDFSRALMQYRAASRLAPQHAAPWFGVYLVAQATNDSVLASSALVEVKKRNGPVPAPAHEFSSPTPANPHTKAAKASGSG